jgi:hypothetical protein
MQVPAETFSMGDELSRYFNMARESIPCHCPSCRCPAIECQYSFVYICERRRFIYYDIPKNASSTLRSKLFGDPYPLPHLESLRDPRDEISRYFKFAIVRNPWSRMISNWRMFTSKPYRINQLKSMTSNDLSSFDSFCHFAVLHPNHHWQPQTLFLPDPLDFVGRIENMKEAFAGIASRVDGFDPIDLKVNQTAYTADPLAYRDSYTKFSRELISEFYRDDINRFHYDY